VTSDGIQLRRPEDITDRPTIGLHLMVKNGRSVVGRLLDCVGPYLDEVVVVLNDCEDDTREVIAAGCEKHSLRLRVFEVTSALNPDLYITDVKSTYEVGHSLVGESFEVPYTGGPILAEWAAARNVGWCQGEAAYRLHLDADDVVDDPRSLPGLCQLMGERGLDAVSTRYHYDHVRGGLSRADAFRERIARNTTDVVWHGSVHEYLRMLRPDRAAMVDGSLVVRDLRDSTGTGIRIPGRNLKILYHNARRRDWQITSREMVYLAAEARAFMPRLAAQLIEMCIATSRWDEERAWAASMMGEICEEEQNFALASRWYERSLELHPGVLSALRLSRAYFRQERWQECISAFERAMVNKDRPQCLDNGVVYEDSTKILVAVAYRRLGKYALAKEMSEGLTEKHPESSALADLAAKLGRDEVRGA